jgi:esterase/lipase superfamily enzyme
MIVKRSALQRLILLLSVVALLGCGGRPHGVLLPVHAQPPGTDLVNMLVVTTRAQDQEPGVMFSGERGDHISYADISVSIPQTRELGQVQWPSEQTPDPSREFTTVEARVLSKDQAIAAFNNKFEEAVYRFAQITHDSDATITPVLFTWPSRGNLLQYGYDHESASYSRDALENVLQFLARDPNVGEISILAHSMGNWVTLEALRQMGIRNKGLPAKIKNIMLAAPDVDFDVFRRQILAMEAKPSLFTVFISHDDEALAVSRRMWGNKPRLGAIDASTEPYRDQLEKEKITIVDLTNVESDDRLGHGKFAQSPAVVRSIGARLAAGQTLSDGHAGVGQKLGLATAGAVSTVGAAAGVAVATPFAIVDPHTRDNLGDHIQSIGEPLQSVGDQLRAH